MESKSDPELVKECKDFLAIQKQFEGFSPREELKRLRLFGDSSCNMTLEKAMTKASKQTTAFIQNNLTEDRKKELQHQYKMLAEIESDLRLRGMSSIRHHWQDVFLDETTKCNGSEGVPCLQCRNCKRKFAQLSLVLVAASGTSDVTILPRWATIFRHPQFKFLSLEEWSCVPLLDLAILFSPCSKQGKCACIAICFLKYWASKDHLPGSQPDISIAEIKCLYYMGKKTACLILLGLTGRNFGIAVDRHLKDAFRSMGWVLKSCRDEEQISLMIEAVLDQSLWGDCNNVVAGLRQLWDQNKDLMLQVAESKSPKHVAILKKCCLDVDYL